MILSNISDEHMEKAKTAKSLEELKAMAQAEGVEVTDEQLSLLWRELSAGEDIAMLSDNELENVAGGCGADPHETWEGPVGGFSEKTTNFNCPVCGTVMSLVGTRKITSGQTIESYKCAKGNTRFSRWPNPDGTWQWTKE